MNTADVKMTQSQRGYVDFMAGHYKNRFRVLGRVDRLVKFRLATKHLSGVFTVGPKGGVLLVCSEKPGAPRA